MQRRRRRLSDISTPFEFNNSTNSRKSLLSRIGMAAVGEFYGDSQALLGGHGRAFPGVRFVCLLEAPGNTDRPLLAHIITSDQLGLRELVTLRVRC